MRKHVWLWVLLLPSVAVAKWSNCSQYGAADYECYQKERQQIALELEKYTQLFRKIEQGPMRKDPIYERFTIADEYAVAHKAWVKFAAAECHLQSAPSQVAQGSGYGRVYESCLADLYQKRLKEVRLLLKRVSSS